MRLSARAAIVFQFLMRCASSTITSSGAHTAIRSRSASAFRSCDLAEIVGAEVLLPLRAAAGHHPCCYGRRTADLALPLVLERGRADHQHARDAEMSRQDLRAAMAWMVLPRPISSPIRARPARTAKRAPRPGRDTAAPRAASPASFGRAAREQAFEDLRPPRRIAPAGDEVERVVVGAHFVAALRRLARKCSSSPKRSFGRTPRAASKSPSRFRTAGGQSDPARKYTARAPSLRR